MTSLMKQTTIKSYTTSDGQSFTNKSDAVAQEIKLKTGSGRLADIGENLAELLSADDSRAETREALTELVKLSNILDHKPKTRPKKDGDVLKAPRKKKGEAAA